MADQEDSRLRLSPSPLLQFTTPARYVQYLLDKGIHYESSVLKPAIPLVQKIVADVLSAPKVEDICHADNSTKNDVRKRLLFACAHGVLGTIEGTLNTNPDLDLNVPLICDNEQGLSPLSIAAMAPQATPVLELLIRTGAGVDLVDHMGRTALHWAVLCDRLASVKILLKRNANLNIVDNQGFTPLLIACLMGFQDAATTLVKTSQALSSSQHHPSGVSAVMLACIGGHADIVKLLIKHRTDVLATDKHGCSAIHSAVWGGSLKCIKLVMSQIRGGGIQLKDNFGCSPLMHATAKGDPTICQLLSKKGVDLGEADSEGRTVLHWAILSQNVASVEFVINYQLHSSLCNQPDNDGATPAHYAAITGSTEILEILKTKHAALHVEDRVGYSPLLWAAASGKVESVNLLLNERDLLGASNQSESGRLQPLHAASCVGNNKVCRLLLEAKAQVNVVSPDGYAPIHYACRYGHAECAELLLGSEAQLDLPSQSSLGDLPIHLASVNGHSDVLEILINHGADVDKLRVYDHRTSLQVAAEAGRLICCKLLVERGADVTLRDNSIECFTALDLAMLNGHMGCSDFLFYCHAPSGGGVYHRAALTIQSVWKLYRHKCRCATAKHWAAVVIQRAACYWLGRRKAQKLRQVRERVRNRAASVIQYHWKLYLIEKKRYEATYAKLKARLEQEHLATTIILGELHSQAQCISLPTPATKTRSFTKPTPPGHNPKYLLKTSSNPQPLFPSGSLLFPAQPRRPLIRQAPNIRVVQRAQSNSKGTPPLPVVQECVNEPPASDSIVSSSARVRLPPIPSNKTHVTISAKISMDFPNARRTQDDRSEEVTIHVVETSDVKLPPISHSTLVKQEVANSNMDDRTEEVTIVETSTQSDVELPPVSHSTLTSAAKQEVTSDPPVISDNVPITLPPINPTPGGISVVADSSKHMESGKESKSEEINSSDEPLQTSSFKIPSQCHFRQTTFKDAPLGYKPPLHKCKNDDTPKSKKKSSKKIKSSTPPKASTDMSSEVLHQVQRYDRLNEVLTLLQQAKKLGKARAGEGEDGEPALRLSDLKQHIQTALDEAVRLRTDTEALQNRIAGQSSSNAVNS